MEGFSGQFVDAALQRFKPRRVLDPFCGCGTTLVEATLHGTDSVGVDVNPFLCFVTKVKTRLSIDPERMKRQIDNVSDKLEGSIGPLNSGTTDETAVKEGVLRDIFGDRPYFSKVILRKIQNAKDLVMKIEDEETRDIFRMCLGSILLKVSNLRRGPDLAYKKEKLNDAPVYHLLKTKLFEVYTDLRSVQRKNFGRAQVHEGDAKDLRFLRKNSVDLVVTSPPYLNGTNYVRNTKLELWVLDFISEEGDLRKLRDKAITAGINDVVKAQRGRIRARFDYVNEIVEDLNERAYDARIPLMVEKYFDDINEVMTGLQRVIGPGGHCVWVVGDSQFSNVYVPTDDITSKIAASTPGGGLRLVTHEVVRQRRSRSGMKLRESVLVFGKDQ